MGAREVGRGQLARGLERGEVRGGLGPRRLQCGSRRGVAVRRRLALRRLVRRPLVQQRRLCILSVLRRALDGELVEVPRRAELGPDVGELLERPRRVGARAVARRLELRFHGVELGRDGADVRRVRGRRGVERLLEPAHVRRVLLLSRRELLGQRGPHAARVRRGLLPAVARLLLRPRVGERALRGERRS